MAQNENGHTRIEWQSLGGWRGGTVTALAFSPHFAIDKIALAGTLAGLFLSTNGGASWQRSSRGLDDPQITTLTTATTTNGLLALAATQIGQLYRAAWSSTPATIDWQPLDSWAGLGVIQALAVSPAYTEDHTLFTATNEGTYRSQDDGATWESSTFGLMDLDILCLACAPDFADSELLWAGSAEGGLYRSRNGARSWRDSGGGLPDSAMIGLLVSPHYPDDQTLYVATETDGIYYSTDGSATWRPFATALAGLCVNAMACDAEAQQWLVATTDGLFLSSDHGETWQKRGNQQEANLELPLLAVAVDKGCALTGTLLDGIVRSVDDGATWAPANQGLVAHAAPFSQLTTDNELFALDIDGLLARYADDANQWLPWNHPFGDAAVTAIAATTVSAKPLIVATETELFVQADAGKT
ncbi:MAG: hypothetical protein KDE31_15710, partial [Caldilineaceae bacterium]|nr:hypothetical protein [Caldilineaceae bacterium]